MTDTIQYSIAKIIGDTIFGHVHPDETPGTWDQSMSAAQHVLATIIVTAAKAQSVATTPLEPDFCFDPACWEFTCDWSDRDHVHGFGDGLKCGQPMRIGTLIKGPDKWVADVPIAWDENGEVNATAVRWFDGEEDARAALAATEVQNNAL